MNTCEAHDGIMVYDRRDCPICQLVEEKEELEKKVELLERQIEDLEARES